MLAAGLDRICISTGDIKEALEFYCDVVGMTVIGECIQPPLNIRQLWNLPDGMTARSVFLKKDGQFTMLELIAFDPISKQAVRDSALHWDFGLYDVGFFVKDLNTQYEKLSAQGYDFVSPPIQYKPDWAPFSVKESILWGPDRMPIAHIEFLTADTPVIAGDYGKLSHTAMMVENMDQTIAFYRDVLGLFFMTDVSFPARLVEDVLTLPPGTSNARLAFATTGNFDYAGIEFLEFSCKGNSLAAAARPPHRGLFMISFEVTDIAAAKEVVKSKRIKIWSGPAERNAGLDGMVIAMTVEGPNGELIELCQKDDKHQ
jgi:catechol 2,3-dioxygenase-like lactoylglutathione lyase family enzyme